MIYGVKTVAESPRSRIRGVIKIKQKGGNTENKMAELKTLVHLANRYLIALR